MTGIKISYKHYDAEGRELDEQDILTTGKQPFFNAPGFSDLIGSKRKSSLLKKHSDVHTAHVAEIENVAQNKITNFLTENANGIQTDVAPILFPDTKTDHSTELLRQTKALHEALIRAAEWTVSQSDGDAKAWLMTIGEYAESKIVELPWQETVPPELYLITLLNTRGPEEFLKIQKDRKLSAYVTEYINELNQVRQNCPKKIVLGPDGDISDEGKKFAENIHKVHQKFGQNGVLSQIKEIEDKRESRAKNYGIFGRIFNFLNVVQKRKLSNLEKIRDSNTPKAISNFNHLAKGNAELREKYDNTAKLIDAKHYFENFNKQAFLNNPAIFKIDEISKLREAVKRLLNSELRPKLLKFMEEAKLKTTVSLQSRDFTAQTAANLERWFVFFNDQPTDDIADAIDKRLTQFITPESGMNYINLLKKANPAILRNNKLDKIIREREAQYIAWNDISGFRQKVLDDRLLSEDIETLFVSATVLLSQNGTSAMAATITGIVEPIKNKIKVFFLKEKPTAEDIERTRKYLALFNIEKLNILHDEKLKVMTEAREVIKNSIIARMNHTTSLAELDKLLAKVQLVWPEAIYPEYIVIHNRSNESVKVMDGQRLDTLPERVEIQGEARNFAVAIGGVTLHPDEQRSFRCNPILRDNTLQEAINEKAKSLILLDATISKVEKEFAPRINFLKTKDKGMLGNIWSLITGNTETALTAENQQKYVSRLVDDYIDVLVQQRLNGSSDERQWVNKQVVKDVEEVAEALNRNLNNLLNESEQKKISELFKLEWNPVDINHLLLQWQFINQFRTHFACSSVEEVYKRAGMGMIYKMDEFSRNDPQFIHQFLGKMNCEQLQALNATFIAMPQLSNGDTLLSIDFVGDEKRVDDEGQTVLRQSMLLSGVSELVKQELLKFLNDEPLNLALFEEHVEFVCANLPSLNNEAVKLNNSVHALQFRDSIKTEMQKLLENDNSDMEEGLTQLVKDLVALAGVIDDSSKRMAFCEKYNFVPSELIKREYSLIKIIESIPAAQRKKVKLCDIFAKADNELVKIADTFITKELKKSDSRLLSDMKYHYSTLQTYCDQINKAKAGFDLIGFIQALDDNVIERLPKQLNRFIRQVQYAFADRFKTGISQILGEANLTTTELAEEKLKTLRSSIFYDLVCLVFDRQEDRENVFKISKTCSLMVEGSSKEETPGSVVLAKASFDYRHKHSLFSKVEPQPDIADDTNLEHSIESIEQRLMAKTVI